MVQPEKFFLPLVVVAAVFDIWACLRSGGAPSAMTPLATNPQPVTTTSGAPIEDTEDTAGSGTTTVQPLAASAWYTNYNQSPLVPQLPINGAYGGSIGCGTCQRAWVQSRWRPLPHQSRSPESSHIWKTFCRRLPAPPKAGPKRRHYCPQIRQAAVAAAWAACWESTAEQVFGANPWLTDPTGIGPNGLTFEYNPIYFATVSTAQQVAQMVGGTVVEDCEFTKNTPGDPFAQLQPNEMVELPDGALINPGLVASFYTHGYPNSVVSQDIASEVAGVEAAVSTTGA